MRARAAALLSAAGGAAGHGAITFPASRVGRSLADGPGPGPGGLYNSWTASNGPAGYPPTGRMTNCGADMRTIAAGAACGKKPWHAPGNAPVDSPCGKSPLGQDGLDMKKSQHAVLTPGGTVKLGCTFNQNHGGGYSWRVCPVKPRATEACFQKTVLQAVSDRQVIHFTNGTEVTIDARRKLLPTGEWTRNPFPPTEMSPAVGFKAPCPGCHGDGRSGTATAWNVIDEYKVPADLPAGDYLISWRWDCEVNTQMYIQCLDAKVAGGPAPAPPAPAPPAPPSAARYGCTNSKCTPDSAGVPLATCQAVCHQ